MVKKEIITLVQQYTSIEELTADERLLVEKAKRAALNAYAPYSQFRVGACVELANGELFDGNNQENAAYPSGLCAERVAMFYAHAQFPNVAAKAIAVTAYNQKGQVIEPVSPCGSCRQVLLESEYRANHPIKMILVGNPEIWIIDGIKQLLPLSFEPSSLNK